MESHLSSRGCMSPFTPLGLLPSFSMDVSAHRPEEEALLASSARAA